MDEIRGKVNVTEARKLRSAHRWSYAMLGRRYDVHQTTVYYALNPKKRSDAVSTGFQHTLYLEDATWERLGVLAAENGSSRSAEVNRLVAASVPDG